MKDRHLISVDELRAVGALDVPPAWRKSLQVERKPSRGLFDDVEDDPEPVKQQLMPSDPDDDESDDDESADELP